MLSSTCFSFINNQAYYHPHHNKKETVITLVVYPRHPHHEPVRYSVATFPFHSWKVKQNATERCFCRVWRNEHARGERECKCTCLKDLFLIEWDYMYVCKLGKLMLEVCSQQVYQSYVLPVEEFNILSFESTKV